MKATSRALLKGTAVAAALGLALATAACADDDNGEALDPDDPRCDAYADYQGHEGTTVGIYASITGDEGQWLQDAWAEFEACTGIDIQYEGTTEYEAQLRVRVDGGNAPDLAFQPQPGLIEEMHDTGQLVEAPDEVRQLAEQNWSEGWMDYATVDGTFYGAPLGSNMKSFVWYSPGFFQENGYQIPETWDELIALSDEIAATDVKPWCAGIGSGDATGWPATDWIEDLIMRLHGPEVYDQWWQHEIPFNDERVVEAFDLADQILRNPDYVNGGYNGPESIATVAFEDGGLPILDGTCAMHRMASFYAANWPEGTTIGEDGDVFAFYFPIIDEEHGRPVLGGAEFVTAFSDAPEVQAVQTYLASAEYANSRASLGAWVSANQGVDLANYESPVDRLAAETLRDPDAILLFDGSDLMPGTVGAGSFWTEITEWIIGQDTQTTVDNIEDSWPS